MRKNCLTVAIAVLSAVTLVVSGCSWLKGPQKKPGLPTPQQKQAAGPEPDISVYMHETGEKKTMKMEDYIAGVVAGEMKTDWPIAALAAQAILARTFTVERLEAVGGVPERGTQASTDIKEFQAYNAKAVTDNVRQAVNMTRGMIVTYQGRPIHAWFHASAGGKTATAKEGLNFKAAEPAYIQSVDSPDDEAPPDIKMWTVSVPKAEMMAALSRLGQQVGSIDSVEIGQRGPSGRAMTIVINKSTQVPGPDLRVNLGGTKVKSMLLDKVEVAGDTVTFSGRGSGHGVGMSQWGAYKMAMEGKKPEDIIGYYFKGVNIEQRWQ